MELHLLSAALTRRDSCYLVAQHIDQKENSREFQLLFGKVKEYYDRDPEVTSVNREIFLGLLEQSFTNKKHLANFVQLVDEAYGLNTSTVNTHELILNAKLHEVATRLSVALVNKDDSVTALLKEYERLKGLTTLEELNGAGTEVYEGNEAGLDSILASALSTDGRFQLYPLSLNERLGGKAAGGHHIVTFARPETGKTAFNITLATGLARHGHRGIYFINEDRTEDLYLRAVSCITGRAESAIRADREGTKRLALERGFGNIIFISLSPGSPSQVEALVERYEPEWFVMDQLRNLNVREANKVLQLEYATTAMRNIAKKYSCLAISTTQAGDSAHNKRYLDMGDVDFSNTGVAAQADVLLGIGATQEDYEQGRRFITLSKNKLSGRHESFPVRIHTEISRYTSASTQGTDE